MSTIPKPIQDAAEKYCNDTGIFQLAELENKIATEAFISGYQLATDGREELEKEIEEYERGNKILQKINTKLLLQIEELKAENERLKGENEYYLKDLKRLDDLYGHLKT